MRPLEILVERYEYGDTFSEGRVYVDGMHFGESMEPPSKHLSNNMTLDEIKKKKVKGKTAIPCGRYKVTLAVSPKFKDRSWAKPYDGECPLLNNVPGFSGVLLHPLNYGRESEGCIGIGEKWKPGVIVRAQQGHFDLMDHYILPSVEMGREIYITIKEV